MERHLMPTLGLYINLHKISLTRHILKVGISPKGKL